MDVTLSDISSVPTQNSAAALSLRQGISVMQNRDDSGCEWHDLGSPGSNWHGCGERELLDASFQRRKFLCQNPGAKPDVKHFEMEVINITKFKVYNGKSEWDSQRKSEK